MYEGHLGSDHPELVHVMLLLAAACGSMGDGARRRELLERAVKARETSDHPDLAQWLKDEGILSMSLNPDTVVDTWQRLAAK
jgi:phosphoenolpyruvate synthase/pyruvate phosphate dikinase